MSHPDSSDDPFRLALGVFALNALPDDERRVMEAHIARCQQCRTEYDGFRDVVAGLALLSEKDLSPPGGEERRSARWPAATRPDS
ncbi:zf-HC2 domain-containing protein [Micromonospora fulviviridis]|uniref:Zf-HC2 domain-containing protein n=1 Tax=Micromonospora fulviviridis TaxID=47860 RepID=A0ABV2VV21_9ACTN